MMCMLWQGNVFAHGIRYVGFFSDRISGALNTSIRISDKVWVEIDRFRELEAKYHAVQQLVERYRLEKDKFDTLKRENENFRKLLNFPASRDYPELKAEVLGVRLNSISPRLIIGKGEKDGVSIYMPVVTTTHDKDQNMIRAVVGIVVDVTSSTAVVRPIIHSNFRMGVRLPDSGQWAIFSGNSGSITMGLVTYISHNVTPDSVTISQFESTVDVNSEVLTSGSAGIFPPGIPVGIITKEGIREGEFRTAFVKPYANISNLDQVSVILKVPERWPESYLKERRWEEGFITPFDEPEFDEIINERIARKPAQKKKKEVEPAPVMEPTSEKKIEDNQIKEEKLPGEKKEKKQEVPRKLQNLDLPG